MELTFKRFILFSLALMPILSISCSDDVAPGDCIAAARDAGVPNRVIEWMKDPAEELLTIERIAIREALEIYGIGEFCADVENKLDAADSEIARQTLDIAKDATAQPASSTPEPAVSTPNPTPSTIPTPTPTPTAAIAPTPSPTFTPVPTPTAAAIAPTPSPIPTATPTIVPTPTGLRDVDTVQITRVTFSGTAGKPDSRFVVHFDRPVVIGLPIDFDIDYDEAPVTLEVGDSGYEYGGDSLYYSDSLNELPILPSELWIRRPTDRLSFGPVEREFTVAHYLTVTDAILQEDGSSAFDRQWIKLPGDTAFLNPGYDTDIADPSLVSCVALMQRMNIPSAIVRSVKDISPGSLTDSEREEWQRLYLDSEYIRFLHYSGGIWGWSEIWTKEPCVSLWSEDANESNSTKRNRDWEKDCFGGRFAHEDTMTLVNRPYTDLDGTDRIALRMFMESQSIWACRLFYPQLFYGRWVPMTRN